MGLDKQWGEHFSEVLGELPAISPRYGALPHPPVGFIEMDRSYTGLALV
jgi:hypothetical protein